MMSTQNIPFPHETVESLYHHHATTCLHSNSPKARRMLPDFEPHHKTQNTEHVCHAFRDKADL